MKNTTILFIVAILIVAGGAYLFGHTGSASANVIEANNAGVEAQKVVISMQNGNYYPREIRVKAGQPISVSLDSSVQGCLRSFTVPDFNVAKVLPTPQDSVTFTPNKKGTYQFRCSMGMGTGKLIVE